jgi:polyphosphate kinase
MAKKLYPIINREISWLYFNERVLQEAADPSVPLIERLRFLAIFSSNLDEFYRVRVATLNRLADLEQKSASLIGYKPKDILNDIQSIVVRLEQKFDQLYEHEIIPKLEEEKIFIINETQLSTSQSAFVQHYFRQQLLPKLVPILLSSKNVKKPFPELTDRRVYLFIRLTLKKKVRYALLEVPTRSLPRFLELPAEQGKKFIILQEDIIRNCLEELFFIFRFDQVEAYSIQMTRDAELDLEEHVGEKFVDALTESLQRRGKGRPMRLLYDSELPETMLTYLIQRTGLPTEALIPGGRYQQFKDFIKFPNLGVASLEYPSMPPMQLTDLKLNKSIFSQMAKKDYLVNLPYQSFDYIVHFLREAAIDPKVTKIYICLYRLAENSSVINALINAAKNGKQVHCLIELKARFDEEANLYWRNKLVEGGVNVNIGMLDFKVHAKICLIVRREKRKYMYYANLATGNFNEKTATLYADHSLFTVNPLITKDLMKLFEGLHQEKFYDDYAQLITSPLSMRKRLYALIDGEIAIAKTGAKSYMILKMNSLTDQPTIQKLYEANNAGVKIQLIIRGMCCLIPGQEGYSEHITIRSIVDRYLEHARVWIFGNGGEEKIYLTSADMMSRNIDRRVEVGFPILDPQIRAEIRKIIDIQLMDNTKAREINAMNDNRYLSSGKGKKIRAQSAIYEYLKNKS